jgi:hypothetical protein
MLLGLAGVAVLATAVPLALTRHDSASAAVRVAPLSATDRRVLTATRPLIESLPAAITQVPVAASDASHGRLTPGQVRRLVTQTPGLAPLSQALADPRAVTAPLTSAYFAVLNHKSVSSVDRLAGALESLQSVEGEIEPAVRLAEAHGGAGSSSAAAALTAIESDHHARAVAGLVGGWQQIYGAFTLVEQSVAGGTNS